MIKLPPTTNNTGTVEFTPNGPMHNGKPFTGVATYPNMIGFQTQSGEVCMVRAANIVMMTYNSSTQKIAIYLSNRQESVCFDNISQTVWNSIQKLVFPES